ncbi:MAG: NgoFVII family restriction endonuclease, partial [Gammaproteobacteria bacterium]
MTVQLRPYQQEAVKELEKSYQKGDRGLLALPTGAGKTFTAAWFLKDKPETVVWVAHLKELLYQAEETFKRVGRGPIGWWTADKKCIGDGVTLAQIQSCREFPPL